MWSAQQQQLPNGQGLSITLTQDSVPLSYAAVIHGWQTDRDFREFFMALLAAVPFTAFRWETPAITTTTVSRPFECVILPSPGLARPPDHKTFAQYFQVDQSVVIFSNLGQDAILVVPCPHSSHKDYGHLGAFIRHAPNNQQHELWKAVGHAMAKRLGSTAIWLSTAGDGVAWLHVRLDDYPKYYHHGPYRTISE
ncbi:DUF6940 family protein [Leptothoe sp. PORK10 BA2]|uniref:DUF6940 family protein n=1 Tax=Leptothoe sp. PORK10 BA2 TaxID=3110254 RepID=UPI002B20190C|nr:hypothetical protein [Leptothoe sp. PORK10 BA2]MEA5464192.1 hypothetical protein [Leptothoe sp. PORK10 BA2]